MPKTAESLYYKLMTNRRDFLKVLGTAAAGLAIGSQTVTGQARRQKRCVIVGSGLAGLAAGFRLKNAGWDVTILEARNRVGGRVFSHTMPDSGGLICELGAEWVGESHERVRSLCRDFNLPLQKHQFNDFLMQNGRVSRPGEWNFSAQANTAFDKLLEGFERLTPAQQRMLDRKDWWTHLADAGFTQPDLILRELADSTDFGESIRHVSAFGALAEYAANEEPEVKGKTQNQMDYKLTGGNSRLVNELARRIGEANIRTGMKVSEISQRRGIVTVKAGDETFTADACICTAPVASLRKIKFNPPLPLAQQQAAERLIYARIIKNSVLYENRFWKEEDFSMVTDMTSHYYFHSTQNQPGRQGILTAYAIGEKADVLASQYDTRRMNIITRDLHDFNNDAPRLAKGIASYAWQRDEYTEGAYALYRLGQWFGVRPVLARPHLKVLFAGEHIADWQGFMEGAIETGEAAADSLLE